MSTHRNTPSGLSESAIAFSTTSGFAWSWTASKTVMKSNCVEPSSVAASLTSNVDVGEAQLGRFVLRGGDAFRGEVETGEAAVRELLGHQVDGVALAAADVADVDALAQPVDQPVDERQLTLDQRGVVDLTAHLGHQLLELREA